MSPREERFAAWRARPSRSTLDSLLEASQDRIFAICREVLHHHHDAEEAAQEALLEIVTGIDAVENAEHYERWSGKVAFRTALDRKRTQRHRREREIRAGERQGDCSQAYQGLHETIARLHESERTLILDRYFDRRTFEEMGRSRGLSDVAVRKRIEKAHERLKRMLGATLPIFPGDPFSESLFGKTTSAGVMAMKLKTIANGVTLFVLLLIVAGGAWFFMAPRPPESGRPKPLNSKRAADLERTELVDAGPGRNPPPEAIPDAVRFPKAPLDRAQIRAAFLACFERLNYVSRRAAECKAESREALSEEEGRRLQREAITLNAECGPLYGKLEELASQDPAMIVDLVRTATELPGRRGLAGLIAPDVDAEISSEDAPSGPLLSGLLTQANGDVEDRMYLAAFAGHLMRGNGDLGRVLLNLMNDSDHNVRMNAAWSLAELVRGGALKAFLTEQSAALQQLSLQDLVFSDYQVRGGALRALAALKSDSADDFILQQFEGLQSRTDSVYGIQAAMMVAPRVAARHEARLVGAILRALDLPFEKDIHYGLRQMAYSLPVGKRDEILRLIDLKPPDPALGSVYVHSSEVSRRSRGRGMTGVSRVYYDNASSPVWSR